MLTFSQPKKSYFLVSHPSLGENALFSSFTAVCEEALELATEQLEQALEPWMKKAICEIADQIVETAVPYEPTEQQIAEWLRG